MNLKLLLSKFYIEVLKFFEQILKHNPTNSVACYVVAKMTNYKNKHVFGSSWFYMESMYQDKMRNEFYIDLIERNVKDKRVLEIGTGLGYLTHIILKNNPQELISCEASKEMYEYTKKFLKENQSNIKDFKLINSSSFDLSLKHLNDKKVDLIIHELFSDNLFSECFIESLINAKRLLGPNGRIAPGRVQLCYMPLYFNDKERFKFLNTQKYKFQTQSINKYDYGKFSYPKANVLACVLSTEQNVLFDIDINSDFLIEDSRIISKEHLINSNGIALYFKIIEGDLEISSNPFVIKKSKSHWVNLLYQYSDTEIYDLKVTYKRNKLSITPIKT